ncbi:hypothetical protein IPJ72_05620 [Candidatus Peregrinibacteria bacterium]|nr:MAG: hypothetical protein IPJ72_05620 [Candidatus Peregrinibacteria bacterium]
MRAAPSGPQYGAKDEVNVKNPLFKDPNYPSQPEYILAEQRVGTVRLGRGMLYLEGAPSLSHELLKRLDASTDDQIVVVRMDTNGVLDTNVTPADGILSVHIKGNGEAINLWKEKYDKYTSEMRGIREKFYDALKANNQ